jgi:hypothetical protein
MKRFRQLSISLTVAFLALISSQTLQAAMVTTPQMLSPSLGLQDLATQREAIRQQLVDLGVEEHVAQQRVAALSQQQISEINRQIGEMPAGADAAGILLTIFIVFVITDIIGATDVFPFIHPVK